METAVNGVVTGMDMKVQNFEEQVITPIRAEVGFMKKTFVYGVLGAVIVVLGQKVINSVWDKVFSKDEIKQSSIADLKALPMKDRR